MKERGVCVRCEGGSNREFWKGAWGMDRQTQDSKQLHSTQLLESCPFLLRIYIKEIHIYCHACMFTSCLQIQLVKKRGTGLNRT